jgi:hypothetical protein
VIDGAYSKTTENKVPNSAPQKEVLTKLLLKTNILFDSTIKLDSTTYWVKT